MKDKIHPNYQDTKIICSCGSVIETRSTRKDIHVEICSSCHPFFTGTQKLIDTDGRVERFRKRYAKKDAPKLNYFARLEMARAAGGGTRR